MVIHIYVLHLLIKPKLKPRLTLETVQHNLVFWFFWGGGDNIRVGENA